MAGGRKLDRRITIMKIDGTELNSFGEDTDEYVEHGKFWARREDIKDGERLSANQVNSSLVARFTVRARSSALEIDPKMRIVHGGETFGIAGVKSVSKWRGRYLEITAEAQSD